VSWWQWLVASGLVYELDGSAAHIVFQMRPGAYNDGTLIAFLTNLDHLEQQRPVVLIWGSWPRIATMRGQD
jgi:hypothetical protein